MNVAYGIGGTCHASSRDKTQNDSSTEKNVAELHKLIDDIEIAMFTTRRSDGALVSRPMATQKQASDADLYFVTDLDSPKLRDLDFDRHVNVSYYRDRTKEWVSVAGVARVSRDRKRIKELYRPDWKAWFGDEGGERNGGPDDPRIGLILVEAESVEYMIVNKPQPTVLFEVAKAMITGNRPDVSEERHISAGDLMDNRR